VLTALTRRGEGFGRSAAFDAIGLARTRFLAGEPDQACTDAEAALAAAAAVSSSGRVTARLGDLLTDSEPYRDRPRVRELRERIRTLTCAPGARRRARAARTGHRRAG
jgi:hypothetical protein